MVWELVIEFREKVSINDVIVTTGAGVTFGEFFHWLGRYLSSAPGRGRPWHGVARWTAGFPWTFHETWDGRHQTLAGAPDELGLSADIWHRFRVGYGFALGRVPGDGGLTSHHLQFDGALAALPGYLRPGHFRRAFFDGNLTALSLRVSGGAGRVNADLFGDTLLVGVHDQAIDHPADGGVGRAVTAGVSIAYRYRNEQYGAFRDRLGIMHLPGPALDGHLVGRSWRLGAFARASADFAALHALPYPEWKAANPDVRDKTILDRHRYYFGWGVSGRLGAELELPRVALGGAVFRGRYASQEGYDRSQERVELDVSASDTVADYDAWLRVTPLSRSRAYLELRASRRDRGARVGDVHAEQGVRLVTLEVGTAL
jgi:hypothetical protein